MTTVRICLIAFFAGFLLLFSAHSLLAQETPYIQFDVDDGLPSNYVYRVLQDRKGYIWMATDAGAARFNGQNFQLYTVEDGLTNNDILNLQEDSQGRLWFLTLAGGFCYYKDGVIHNPDNDPKLRGGPETSFIAYFFEDSRNYLWFYTSHEGVFCMTADTILRFPVPGEHPYFGIGGMWEGAEGKVYARTRGRIWQIYPKIILMQDSLPPFSHVAAGFPKGKGKGILISDYEGNVFTEYKDNRVPFAKLQSDARCIMAKQLQDSSYWLATYEGGVERWEPTETGKVRLTNTYFPTEVITSVAQDSEGNHWFSTAKSGVLLMRPYEITNYTQLGGMQDPGIHNIFKDSQGYYWFCSHDERVSRAHHFGGPVTQSDNRAGYEFNGVLDLPTGGILSYGSGLMLVPDRDPRSVHLQLRHNANSIVKDFRGKNGYVFLAELGAIKHMLPGKDGKIWGASNLWLFQYDPQFHSHKGIKHLKKGRFSALAEGEAGTMWVGRNDGLFAYINGKLESHQEAHDGFSGAPQALAYSPSTGLWVATNGQGLINYDPITGQTWQFTSGNYLAGNLCQNLTLVDDRQLWVATKSGLSRIDLDADFRNDPYNAIHTLTKEEGLLTNEVSSIYVEGDTIMACTPKGVSIFASRDAERRLPHPPLFLDNITFGDQVYAPDTPASLPHSDNSPTFSFTALSFGSLGKVRYEYRISPLEDDFNSTSQQTVSYNTLAPGSYTFILRAIAKDGTPSTGEVRYNFTIRKAWWQTWLFRIATALVLGFLIWSGVMLRFRDRSRRIEMERKFLESERKALRAQMNPHFIFNSLNSIQNFLAKNDRKAAYTYLARFGKLIRSILENSDKTYITIEEELKVLELYLQMESLRADHQFSYEIVLDPEIRPHQGLIPPMLLQPYVENAIWHGVLPKKTGGRIHIELKARDQGIWCRIEDNGVGRKAAAKSGVKAFEKRSFGTRITEERLGLLNDKRRKKISVATIDLTDPNGNALGTRVELIIPFVRKDLSHDTN